MKVFGWIHNPEEIEKVVSMLPNPDLYGANPLIKDSGIGKDVFGWEFEQKVLNKLLPAWNQGQIGSCVGHGTGRAVQDTMIVEIALGDREELPAEVNREAIYGGSRCEVGNQWNSMEDGSVGAWAAKFIHLWGIILNLKYKSVDLSGGYSEQRCKQWGAKGMPDELEPDAKLHPVQEITTCNTAEKIRDAVTNGHFVAICGQQGRTMKRQIGGWCRVTGSWSHCQQICGYCLVKGNKPALVYRNSWGDYLGNSNNQVQLESGREIILPDGCYLSTMEEVDKDARLGDTFGFSSITGFPTRDINRALFDVFGV